MTAATGTALRACAIGGGIDRERNLNSNSSFKSKRKTLVEIQAYAETEEKSVTVPAFKT